MQGFMIVNPYDAKYYFEVVCIREVISLFGAQNKSSKSKVNFVENSSRLSSKIHDYWG